MSRKINIDICRFICSLLIVAIHISPFEKINPELDFFFTRILARVGVPLFLMITGYFILSKASNDKEILKKYIKKILKIYFVCVIIYIPINIYNGTIFNNSIISIVKDIFIDGTFYHLWYFPSLILGLVITYFILKLNEKYGIIICLGLYIIGLFGDSYYGLIEGNELIFKIYHFLFNIFDYTRNGLFFVPIFLYLGVFIKNHSYKSKYSIIYILIFFICMMFEGFILHIFKLQKHDSMYIFLIPLMFSLFSYIMNSSKLENKKLRMYATNIYILHPLVIVLVRAVTSVLGFSSIIQNNLIFYFIVCIFTLLFIMFIEKLKEVIKYEKRFIKE